MSYFYLIRFRIRKIDFSYFIAKLVKVSVKANGLYKKSHCSLCGGAMAEQVFPDYYCKILHKDLLLFSLIFLFQLFSINRVQRITIIVFPVCPTIVLL